MPRNADEPIEWPDEEHLSLDELINRLDLLTDNPLYDPEEEENE